MDQKSQGSHVHLSSPIERQVRSGAALVKADGAMCISQLQSDSKTDLDEPLRHYLGFESPRWGPAAWNKRPTRCSWMQILLYLSMTLFGLTSAAFVTFQNCLSPNIIDSDPRQLQFRPLLVGATFNATASSHNLNVTVYGNVSGIATNEPLPPLGDPHWSNPNETLGKIPELDFANNKYTTLKATFNVLDYTPYTADPQPFCITLLHGQCPLGPSFYANG